MRRQPLMLGAVGLAVGAGIAGSLRPTAVEADLLGEASTNVQERAREFAVAAAGRAAMAADDITAAIGQEARAQEAHTGQHSTNRARSQPPSACGRG